jgi:Fur family zinc uptake transcriptional regulator
MNRQPQPAIERRLQKAEEICLGRGVQLTELRRLALNLLLQAKGPQTAYQLLDRLKEIRTGAVPPTIYRALDFLMEQGLVHKIERLNAFIPCVDADHGHHAAQFLICKKCGAVAEIEDRSVSRALERAADRQGFHAESAVVELAGLCVACAASAA